MRSVFVLVCALSLVVGCDEPSNPPRDAASDSRGDSGPRDSGTDSGPKDSGTDSGYDAGHDAGHDAGPACTCSGASTCCDGCLPRNLGMSCDDGQTCSATSTCDAAGACVFATSSCSVPTPACQAPACIEGAGCGAPTNINQGGDCDDGNANTYADKCSSGACAGTPTECSTNNGGCGVGETCVGHDPAPATCECGSGRYQVTADEVYDTTTGLTWRRAESPNTYTQSSAATHCAGFPSSRLPTSTELLSIHNGNINSAPDFIDTCAFPFTTRDAFRTSTVYNASNHYLVNFGGCCGAAYAPDATPYYVRCVR